MPSISSSCPVTGPPVCATIKRQYYPFLNKCYFTEAVKKQQKFGGHRIVFKAEGSCHDYIKQKTKRNE
ncbi:Hypothetical protein NTJ_13509 [Nesidiocoris tenuis]|uniref:Kazal-like domain-containing protein n=1 Tax=Nesidiocoris tenuis TaxID=355587 RepID=A0ABN7B8I6_9HEMI|nr:Hypothetical protein NTJ_13509 [Nesidiocoris tenuis]